MMLKLMLMMLTMWLPSRPPRPLSTPLLLLIVVVPPPPLRPLYTPLLLRIVVVQELNSPVLVNLI